MKKFIVLLVTVFLAVAGSVVAGPENDTAGRRLEVEALSEIAADIAVFPQVGHTMDLVYSAVFSPDGRHIVSASSDGTVKMWDAESGREFRTFFGHTSRVLSVAFSPDGRRIVSASSDKTVKVWDTERGKEVRTLQGHTNNVTSAAYSSDGRHIVSTSLDKTVKVWDSESGRELYTLTGHTEYVKSAAFSPDGQRIISASDDKTLKLWDASDQGSASGRLLRTLSDTSWVESAAFSPDGQCIVSASGSTVKVWDVESGSLFRTFSGHAPFVKSVAFGPDGRRIVSASSDKTVKVWDVESGRLLRNLSGHTSGVESAAFSPDGRRIVSAGGHKLVKVWDVESGNLFRTLSGYINSVFPVMFSSDGRRIVSVSDNKTVKVWDVESGSLLRTLSGHTDSVNSAAFGPDGRRIVSTSDDKTLKLWDTESGGLLRTLSGHTGWVYSATFSPDGQCIVSTASDKTVKVWDVESGNLLRTLSGHTKFVKSATFSPDGRRIASVSSDGTTRLWDVETGREINSLLSYVDSLHDPFASVTTFSPDGRRIVSVLGSTVKVWDVESGSLLRTLSGHTSRVGSAAFSLDGGRIVSTSGDGTVKVWDVESGNLLRTLSGHTRFVMSATFSPDGRRIVSTSGFTIKVWDVESGRELHTLAGHTAAVRSVAFSPDGKQVFSCSTDNTIRLWNAATGKEIAQFVSFSGTDTQIATATRGLTVETETAAASIDGEWLSITPDGYYQASPRGDRYINVRVGNTVSGIDAYRSVLYNPDVVQARLQGRPDPASKSSVTIQQAASFTPPEITLQTDTTTTNAATANLSIAVTDRNQPVKNIKIMVNGRLLGRDELSAVTGAKGLQPERASLTLTGNQKSVSFRLPLALDPGPNRVEVVAFNGYAENRRYIDITRNAPDGERRALPNLWILAVGVNAYADSRINNLSFAVADAQSVVTSLKAQEGKRYGRVNSLLIADGEALAPTLENIRKGLQFLEGAGPRDVVLLFLAGHGVSDNAGTFLFLPGDTRLKADKSVDPARAVTGSEIVSVLDAPGNRLVFIDACQSGGVDNDRLVRSLMDTNAFVFTSSRGTELSQERAELGHGVFTYSILSALKGVAAAQAQGNVSVLSLSGFVSTDVPRMTGDRQHPSAYSLGFYDFPLAVTK
jgi:WD40 repeat protein